MSLVRRQLRIFTTGPRFDLGLIFASSLSRGPFMFEKDPKNAVHPYEPTDKAFLFLLTIIFSEVALWTTKD